MYEVKGFQCPNDSSAFVGILIEVCSLQKYFSSLENVFESAPFMLNIWQLDHLSLPRRW